MKIREIECKSALGPCGFPGGGLSINPYVGCQHACVYCLDGETLILMHDGTSKPLRDIRVGDRVYGIRKDRNTGYHYYKVTKVLARWRSRKPAVKIVTDKGIEVICSLDHRWFSSRGWKYSFGQMTGKLRRPYLTKNNFINGIGELIMSPKESNPYMKGYLSGMIRGDGLLKKYDYSGGKRNKDIQYQFRLVLNDKDAVIRTHNYLNKFGVQTNWFKFKISPGRWVDAIRINRGDSYQKIKKLIKFNSEPEYLRGFAAGIFDAEGTGGSGNSTIRIFNTDVQLLKFAKKSLKSLGFQTVDEKRIKTNCKIVRIRGGLEEYIRFFQTVNPAIKRKLVLEDRQIKRSFRVKEITDLHATREMYDITTDTGTFIANGLVSHNCYARFMKRFTSHKEEWGSFVDARINIAEVLERQMKSPKFRGQTIYVGTVTDPYQPAEAKYGLTRKILEVLRNYKNPVSLLTKSALVLRDLDLLKQMKRVDVNFTIATLNENWKKVTEPCSSTVKQRLKTAQKLIQEGIPVFAMVGPYWPRFTNPEVLFKEFKRIGIRRVFAESFNTVGGNWTGVDKVLQVKYPELRESLKETLFDPKQFSEFYQQEKKRVEELSKKYQLPVTIYFGHGHEAKFK